MRWIDDIILGLLEEHNTREIYELCDALKIEIREVKASNPALKGHDAYYYRFIDDSEVIFVSKSIEPKIKEFALKHELGHAVCHPDLLFEAYKFSNTNKLEKQANYFAFKLSDIHFDEIELMEMTLEQIASCLELPYEPLKQLVNL